MRVNQVILNGQTVLDLTTDTVTPDTLLSGITAHDKTGEQITGTVKVQNYYTGSDVPADTLGTDGDLYLKL